MGYESCWLRYEKNDRYKEACFETIVVKELDPILYAALEELKFGITSMFGVEPDVVSRPVTKSFIWIGTIDDEELMKTLLCDNELLRIRSDVYIIRSFIDKGMLRIYIAGKNSANTLYGVFHFLRLLQMKEDIHHLSIVEHSNNSLRMINHWDNMDGSVERGYAGRSIFFHNGRFLNNSNRVKDYARLLSSVGINAISINNVNVHQTETKLITDEFLPELSEVASIFRTYGVKTFLSINYASPIEIGGLPTADPLDSKVKQWWSNITHRIYQFIPDFGGFIVKADSEFRPGPFTYGRSHADGANMLAEALEPFGGIVIWRCFVYNCQQDWRDRKTDRAKAAYDHFKPLDGQFHDNVILQIKNGPMDFQVREPVSPLFGAMPRTNQMMEVQITQEYTGQQKHLCYLVPQWKEVLEFDTFAKGKGSEVKKVINGSLFNYRYSGMAGVSNIGDEPNWTGHTLAQANLYGFGRLAWNPSLSADEITKEWIIQTFGDDPQVIQLISDMLLSSWRIYENYTSPLGIGWMVNPGHHYGPNVDGYEYSHWGTYHYADRYGIGVDRTTLSGTGYASQYFPENATIYESLEDCPDELLLFFHHVPYSHRLKSGKTVIQHIYDTHFEGVEQAKQLKKKWEQLEGRIDKKRYKDVLERLTIQIEHAKEWRDVINTYFYRKSGIKDQYGRKIYQ
ncbi:alpha-glucuronidase [Anoxybacillus sp. LAT_35]|uniref:alpha-glucuronidase family glycosyl hydrolase n=1 Tax=unclassified Anoxybacillus TaxID=2639704 RepID=UPI001EDAE055|nr:MULTISPECIES: alpha-glucuronidase family glycosyl hydrolase [unclassified Anoxybacillus]MCG5024202.1 alpha-glucuronidase [Anoxybacillus flavithermus]MCG3086102.1 alpha-glucuronidase [Anoxybacillus sp. LAT27]MCG6172896.1 alpha-glucuronidase [Anoxybacillus sp. LAT_11]MCG6173526.1 alpha-glucuronidase [Anoxybacillus sp. LAT_11]MCG6173912.1 alpha-glucuronidase [Anoxybacillus sp. LAT_31]